MSPPDAPDEGDRDAAAIALDTGRDARNRGVRTALQAVIVAVVVDAIPLLMNALDSEDVNEGELVKALIRVVLAAVLSFAMRYAAPPPAPGG